MCRQLSIYAASFRALFNFTVRNLQSLKTIVCPQYLHITEVVVNRWGLCRQSVEIRGTSTEFSRNILNNNDLELVGGVGEWRDFRKEKKNIDSRSIF